MKTEIEIIKEINEFLAQENDRLINENVALYNIVTKYDEAIEKIKDI